jgi:hypothetical protein
MMIRLRTVFFLVGFGILYSLAGHAQGIRVVLTGNTVDLRAPEALFQAMEAYCAQTPVPVYWVLNGDVFPVSAADASVWVERVRGVLDKYPQLTVLLNQGDREWSDSGPDGWEHVQRLGKMLQNMQHPRLISFLEQGCPGPWSYSLKGYAEVIVVNTQWWNHPYTKPAPYTNDCPIADEGVFLEKVTDLLDDCTSRNVLFLSHFPLASLGRYGGRFPLKDYLLPPVVGSARVSYHQTVGTRYDLVNDHYAGIRAALEALLNDYTGVVMASGHERNHSVLRQGDNVYINSGALMPGDYAGGQHRALLSSAQAGFVVLAYDTTGRVDYQFVTTSAQGLTTHDGGTLVDPSVKPVTHTPVIPVAQSVASSVQVVAGPEYAISGIGRAWLGKHYRPVWTTPVMVPYLSLDTTFGGLSVLRRGGGRQTTSLKLQGGNGREYVFRSVNKDPSKALDRAIRGTVVYHLIKDQTSNEHPYGALAASTLLDHTGVLHARPRLYVLPSDPRLGELRAEYGNLFGMLEDSPSDKIPAEKIFGGADKIERSYKLFQKLYEDHDNHVDRAEFCRARVFDMLVGDWGKHEDNWKWAGYKVNGGYVYRPIPRDRDHVFSRWDGILPFLADREWAKPTGEDFGYRIRGLRSLMHQARHMDRLLTNQLTRADWVTAARTVADSLSEAVISTAVRQMPTETYTPMGREVEAKLKARRLDLPDYAAQYYAMLAKEVDVVGSNKAEYFQATRHADGTVTVVVCDLVKGAPDFQKIYYSRRFEPQETREIRLYGLTGHDVFVIRGAAPRSILIRIVGGDAPASITDSSSVAGHAHKTLVYLREDAPVLQLGEEAQRVHPKDERLYAYQRTAFAYNTYMPRALVTYNPFNGLAVHTGVTFTRHNFSKPDFSARHSVKASVTTVGNYELSYENRLRYLVGRWDGVGEVTLSRPLTYNYFFGVGNDTERDNSRPKNYYRTQYNSFLVRAGFMRTFWRQSEVAVSAAFESAEGLARAGSFLEDHQEEVLGMAPLDMISVRASLDLDLRNDRFLPARGFRFMVSQEGVHIGHARDDIASVTVAVVEHYLSTYTAHPVTLGIRAGGGKTSGDLPFYKLVTLGQLDNLHGFRRNRFTGDAKAYVNTELRWQVAETHNSLVPVKVGVRAFYDVGRVWADNDPSSANYWHQGYGAGFYVVPFMNQLSLNVNFGASEEESFLIMFGIGASF